MWHDVVDLREFYETRRGQVARHMVRRGVRSVWPDVKGQRVLGLGFATPYLRQFRSEAERVLAFMPASQGVLHWPPEGPGVVSLVEETELPLPDLLRRPGAAGSRPGEQRSATCPAAGDLAGAHRRWPPAGGGAQTAAASGRAPTARRWAGGIPTAAPSFPGSCERTCSRRRGRSGRSTCRPPPPTPCCARPRLSRRIGARFFPTFAGVVMIESGKQLYAGSAKRVRGRIGKPVVVQLPQAAGRVHRERTPKPI